MEESENAAKEHILCNNLTFFFEKRTLQKEKKNNIPPIPHPTPNHTIWISLLIFQNALFAFDNTWFTHLE